MLNASCIWMYTSFFRFRKFSAIILVKLSLFLLILSLFYLCTNLQVLLLKYIPHLEICFDSLSFSTYMFILLSSPCHIGMLIGLIMCKSCASSHSCLWVYECNISFTSRKLYSLTSSSYIVSDPSSAVLLDPWK